MLAACSWTGPTARRGLEVELVDVRLGEEVRLAEQDVVAIELDLLESAGGEGRIASLEPPLGNSFGDLDGQIAEIRGVPEYDRLRDPLVDIRLVVIGQA